MSIHDQQPNEGRRAAYTGETIVMPRRRAAEGRPTRRPRRSIWPKVRLALLVALGLVLLLVLLIYLQVRGVAGQVVTTDARTNAPIASPLAGGVNVLLIGVDERPGFPGEGVRSDTLIVARLDSAGRWVNLLSVPRDTLATVPDFGATKINAAYAYGYNNPEALFEPGTTAQQAGMALAAQTVEGLLQLRDRGQRIDFVAQVNFDGFATIVDALGGVTIDVPKYILDAEYPTPDFGTMRVEFQPGVQRMDGATALIYARTRHADSDFDRGERQQQVMRAILAELRKRGPVGQALTLPGLLEGLEGAVATTMPLDRPDVMLAMAWLASGLDPDEIGQVQLSPEIDPNVQQGPGFELQWSEAGIDAAVDRLLARPSEAAEEATVQVLNGTGVAGLAGQLTDELAAGGVRVLPAGDAPTSDVARTAVYDVAGKPRTSRRLADELGAELRRGAPEGVDVAADIVIVIGQDRVR